MGLVHVQARQCSTQSSLALCLFSVNSNFLFVGVCLLCCVRFSFFSAMLNDWLVKMSLKLPVFISSGTEGGFFHHKLVFH